MARSRDVDTRGKQFTRSWFRRRNLADFNENLLPSWQGQPITYLGVGLFECQCLVWLFQHVFTHPRSRAVGCDPWLQSRKLDENFMEKVRKRAIANTAEWRDRCTLIRGNSYEVLRRMTTEAGYMGIAFNSVDICLIDGCHYDYAVLDDARQVFKLMKPRGWMVFDDARNQPRKKQQVASGIRMWMDQDQPPARLIWSGKYVECYQVEK